MDEQVVAADPRVGAILADPSHYFARARERAWVEAGKDLRTELDRLHERRNGKH